MCYIFMFNGIRRTMESELADGYRLALIAAVGGG